MRRAFPRVAWILFTVAPLLAASTWTLYPAGRVWLGKIWMDSIPTDTTDLDSANEQQRIRRLLQGHFRNFGHYLPFEDIVIASNTDDSPTALLMQKACGRGKIFVWLSYSFNLPIFGTKVVERCWKPPVKKT